MAEKLTDAQRRARQLTQRGLCSRCGKSPRAHRGGHCPDGRGSFTWSLTDADKRRVLANLQEVIDAAKRPEPVLTADEQSALLAFDGPNQNLTPWEIAERLGWPLERARAALEGLAAKGCARAARNGSN